MSGHAIDYSKSSRSVCKGPFPCTGSPIAVGTIRYGQLVPDQYGETVVWRHWGCVTPDILRNLAITDLGSVSGFSTLRLEDQSKVRRAIASGRVDPSDVPNSAKSVALPASQSSSSIPPVPCPLPVAQGSMVPGQRKRKEIPHQTLGTQHLVNDEDDDVTQMEPEVIDELYGTYKTNVVGVRYYKGLVGAGEQVGLVREPTNQYDRNAIKVINIGGMQVGHIPKDIAAKIASLIDRKLVTIEGTMLGGNLNGEFCYTLPLEMRIYGASDKRNILESQLAWAIPRQRGPPPRGSAPSAVGSSYAEPSYAYSQPSSSQRVASGGIVNQAREEAIKKQQEALHRAAELKQMLTSLEKVDDEGRRASLLDTLCSSDDILNLPEHPNPPSIASGELVVNLLRHQSQALQWCIEHECPALPTKESDGPVQFWRYCKTGDKPYYFNLATKTPQAITNPPVLGRGALVADSMGLGKTLTMIALILSTKADIPTDHSKATLIVVPLSVISNWEKQIADHCVNGAITTCVYYGASRNITADELAKYDVVITTYQTVVGEADSNALVDGERPKKKKKKNETGLFDVKWKRIVLDEGHNIRNPKTKMTKAVCNLTAQRRWVLSGTPIINSPRDVGSMLAFLQICRPLDDDDFFKRLILRPLKNGDPAGAELLRALMNHVCIRRTKEMQDSEGKPLVPLPPVDITLVPVTLDEEARALYDAVEAASHRRVENMMNQAGGVNSAITSNMLSMLTRLRQIALHPGLVPSNYLEQLQESEQLESEHSAIKITPELKERLQSQLAKLIEDNEECPICFGMLADPRITSCTHAFCFACISEVLRRDQRCPMDRQPIGMGDLVEPPPPTELTQIPVKIDDGKDQSNLSQRSSAKIDQLVHLLKLLPCNEKSLVFSQFTSFLDKIGETLDRHGIPYVRFDGQLSAKKRQQVLERFTVPLEEELSYTSSVEALTQPSTAQISAIDNYDACDDDEFDENVSSRAKRSASKGKRKALGGTTPMDTNKNSENPKIMLISLKAGALGLNLTVANNVFLMDPWWQEGIESQAIDRCNRIGQKKPVHVYQFIAENTVEAKVIETQEKKKKLIQHAFSGTKRTETQHERREARLQELGELFGIRRNGTNQ